MFVDSGMGHIRYSHHHSIDSYTHPHRQRGLPATIAVPLPPHCTLPHPGWIGWCPRQVEQTGAWEDWEGTGTGFPVLLPQTETCIPRLEKVEPDLPLPCLVPVGRGIIRQLLPHSQPATLFCAHSHPCCVPLLAFYLAR